MQGLHALIATAAFLAANLDSTVRPGDGFFQYANGGWLQHNPIPDR